VTPQKKAPVISEIHFDPKSVNDNKGEWFEVYNPGDVAIDMNGKVIALGTKKHTINYGGPLIIAAKGYLVLGNNTDQATNGGVGVAYAYPVSGYYLSNSNGTTVAIQEAGGKVLTSVTYTPGKNGWPTKKSGTSFQLSSAFLNTSDSSNATNWCYAADTSKLPSGDIATPGAANNLCISGPPPIDN
jgi:hypothetical protein